VKTVPIVVLAQITTTLECVTLVDVPDDATESDILAEANRVARELDGGEFDEIPDSGTWSIYDVTIPITLPEGT
jgi:hypothetical protein